MTMTGGAAARAAASASETKTVSTAPGGTPPAAVSGKVVGAAGDVEAGGAAVG
ncbi:hypothetical protein [Nakamurella flava]|uniref:hypothetical protein n=1 Tax=Nakamurella flava TaxID=2576308 RepID=UPI0014099FFE|nr:hypothetical protein [Nakamurella flava]